METTALLYLIAVFGAARCSPLGQSTVCESSPVSGATVCESLTSSLPGILAYLCGLPGAFPGMPYPLPYPLPYPAASAATVCESTPVPALPALGCGGYPLGLPLGMGIPNLQGVGALGYPYPLTGAMGSTTVCESSPNPVGVGPYGLPLGGLGPFGLPLGGLGPYGLPLGGLGLGLSPAIPFL